MAQDVVGVLDALSIERAHIVGLSLGGMVAQHVAFSHGERCLSLASVMSTWASPACPPRPPRRWPRSRPSPKTPAIEPA